MKNYEEEIIINELPLTEVFIPTRLLYREGQVEELARCLKPALKNRSIQNVFLVGESGTGKTTTGRWVLESNFKEISAYVNCWKYRSTHEVLKEILLSFRVPVHGREPTGELIKKLEMLIRRKRIIVFLDEVDQLKDFDILYILARNNCGLILATTRFHTLMKLPSRIKSSLALTEIEFPKYTWRELFEILKDRIRLSLRPNSIRDELIKIASVAADGDARTALEIIRRSARKAENKGLKEITIQEIKEAVKETRRTKIDFFLSRLNYHQKTILELLQRNREMYSGDLYMQYKQRAERPLCRRAYRKTMEKLVRLGLVESVGYGRWRRYRHTL